MPLVFGYLLFPSKTIKESLKTDVRVQRPGLNGYKEEILEKGKKARKRKRLDYP